MREYQVLVTTFPVGEVLFERIMTLSPDAPFDYLALVSSLELLYAPLSVKVSIALLPNH